MDCNSNECTVCGEETTKEMCKDCLEEGLSMFKIYCGGYA